MCDIETCTNLATLTLEASNTLHVCAHHHQLVQHWVGNVATIAPKGRPVPTRHIWPAIRWMARA